MEATCSFKTAADFNGLHGFISQKIELFKRELHLGLKILRYWDTC
jgi:hypothetical protein